MGLTVHTEKLVSGGIPDCSIPAVFIEVSHDQGTLLYAAVYDPAHLLFGPPREYLGQPPDGVVCPPTAVTIILALASVLSDPINDGMQEDRLLDTVSHGHCADATNKSQWLHNRTPSCKKFVGVV